MACRGVHFALTEQEAETFASAATDDALVEALEEIERSLWPQKRYQETDKAWDAIHRCLTNGLLEYGESPFHYVIFGDDNLLTRHNFGHIGLVHPEVVREAAEAIRTIDEQWMRERYFALDPHEYEGEICESDFGYTWGWFVPLRAFFEKAAQTGQWVSFTVWY